MMNLALLQLGGFDVIAIAVLIVLGLGIVGWYVWSIVWALAKKPMTGSEALIGKSGTALQDFSSDNLGEVNIEGIIWKARIYNDGKNASNISKGESVMVVGFSALSVIVKKNSATISDGRA